VTPREGSRTNEEHLLSRKEMMIVPLVEEYGIITILPHIGGGGWELETSGFRNNDVSSCISTIKKWYILQ
jgi:hypothetical protein